VTGLVSIYSFGILLAFMAIFLSIVFCGSPSRTSSGRSGCAPT
jgi:hypothetical protein